MKLCAHCDDDTVPVLVGRDLVDLFADLHADGPLCGGIVAAFTLVGRMHIFGTASSCGGDAFSATPVYDMSGPTPKRVSE